MAGAGGGGFIFVLTKEPNMVDEVKAVIKAMKVVFHCFVLRSFISSYFIVDFLTSVRKRAPRSHFFRAKTQSFSNPHGYPVYNWFTRHS